MIDANGIAYIPCRNPDCLRDDDGVAHPYHSDCAALVSSSDHDTQETLRKIAAVSFEPRFHAREPWLRYDMSAALELPGSAELTPAIKFEISQYLVRHYAVALLGSLPIHPPRSDILDIAKPLIFHRVLYEGQRHISGVETRDDEPSRIPAMLYISESPYGISDIVVSRTGAPPAVKEAADFWWKTLFIGSEGRRMVKFDYDVRHTLQFSSSSSSSSRERALY